MYRSHNFSVTVNLLTHIPHSSQFLMLSIFCRYMVSYYYYYYKICIVHKFKHARVGGAGVTGRGNGLAGEGITRCCPDGTQHYWPAACWVAYVSVTDNDNRRWQTPATITSLVPLYTVCRQASNNLQKWVVLCVQSITRHCTKEWSLTRQWRRITNRITWLNTFPPAVSLLTVTT